MPSSAATRSASPIEAVRQASDDIQALIADLPSEQQLVALQRVVAKHAACRFPDVAPESFAHAFAEGVISILRYSPERLARSTPGSLESQDAPVAPAFWMNETGGALRPAIEAYLLGKDALAPDHIAALRAYFRQWIMSPAWPDSLEISQLRAGVHGLVGRHTISAWVKQAIEAGVDPL